MAIIIGGKPVTIDDIKKKEEVVQPIQKAEPLPEPIKKVQYIPPVEPTFVPPKRIIQERKSPQITDGNTLIVNGKHRTIGRKSQYLLDMMIIDDE